MDQALVFVGGVHGAGKTTVCRLLALALSASHVTAGTLIRLNANPEKFTSEGGGKVVTDVDGNQELLLQGLAAYRRQAPGPIVLDGHFSLMAPDGTVANIPTAVYMAIAPIAIVLIESDCEVVHSRLLDRDHSAPPLTTIQLLSERERAWAQTVSATLHIPMFEVRGDISAIDASKSATSQLLPLFRGAA